MKSAVKQVENERIATLRSQLQELISGIQTSDGLLEIFPGIYLARTTEPTKPLHSVYVPCFCVMAQGSKTVKLGEESFTYDTGHYLISTMDLPVSSCVIEASVEKPYMSFRFDLDPAVVADVMLQTGADVGRSVDSVKAMNVAPIDADLLDATIRILRLIDKPLEAKMLLPLIEREIIFRLLQGEQASRLAHLVSGENRRISKAIETLRERYDQPIRIENLARDLGMSVSGFHNHFKAVTAMSPLQFQKQIRLQEARRLMLGEDLDAASAGFRVGYDDPSYFSRDYKKQFGEPPQRDIANLRIGLSS